MLGREERRAAPGRRARARGARAAAAAQLRVRRRPRAVREIERASGGVAVRAERAVEPSGAARSPRTRARDRTIRSTTTRGADETGCTIGSTVFGSAISAPCSFRRGDGSGHRRATAAARRPRTQITPSRRFRVAAPRAAGARYSHVWLIWQFHLNSNRRLPNRVRPPRQPRAAGDRGDGAIRRRRCAGANDHASVGYVVRARGGANHERTPDTPPRCRLPSSGTMAMLATRTPHRFCPIGLTLARLLAVERTAPTAAGGGGGAALLLAEVTRAGRRDASPSSSRERRRSRRAVDAAAAERRALLLTRRAASRPRRRPSPCRSTSCRARRCST